MLPVWPGALLVSIAVCVAYRRAAIGFADLVAVLRAPVGFIIVGSLATVLSFRWSGGLGVGFSDVPRAVSLAARSVAATSAAVLFAMTVPVSELLVRARAARVPAVACELALLMYRLVAVGLHRMRTQRLAQQCRLGYVGFASSMRSAGLLMVSALAGSLRQSERLTVGLGARGFDGTLRVLDDGARHSPRFLAVTVVTLVSIAAVSLSVQHVDVFDWFGGWFACVI